ncbi:MAG TPA: hypothetical protein VF002_07890 [Gaiellaceae bacterium]
MRVEILFLAAFLACAVEMLEALTIVLAVGLTRGWRSTLVGVGAALLALAAVVASLGPALTVLPLNALRLVVGGLLLAFGLQWLRKAILRAGGFLSLRDESAAYAREREQALQAAPERRAGVDWYSFTLSFKGVFLEGLEVAFIVISFGADGRHGVVTAAAAAAAALVIVAVTGVLARAPLSRVPENTLKFAVGLLLTSFGTFWGAEGAGVSWPGGDVAILGILAFLLLVSVGSVSLLRRQPGPARTGGATAGGS